MDRPKKENYSHRETNANKGIDLKKMGEKIDTALDDETDESLTKWFTDKRKDQPKVLAQEERKHYYYLKCSSCGIVIKSDNDTAG